MTLADDGWGSNISYELLAIIVALVAMSTLGQKQTFAAHQQMSALPPKADIWPRDCNARLSPQVISKAFKCRRVGTIGLPDWIVGIAPEVRRAFFLEAAIETTMPQLCEHFATFNSVDVET
jgi:hypothetical protein